jgi:hypothetical protein
VWHWCQLCLLTVVSFLSGQLFFSSGGAGSVIVHPRLYEGGCCLWLRLIVSHLGALDSHGLAICFIQVFHVLAVCFSVPLTVHSSTGS